MEQFRLPDTLSFQGNLAEGWRRWKQQFKVYMVTSGKNDKGDEVKAATFLHIAGPEALEVFNLLTFDMFSTLDARNRVSLLISM